MFKQLSAVNVKGKTEKKGNLTYLSWAWAWAEACKVANVRRTVYENANGWNYHTDGKTAWVKVGVEIAEIEHIDYLPVMDFKNKSIPAANITSMDVNKAIQRSTTKALALHGLGLNVYVGEDLPITPTLPKLTATHKDFELVKEGIKNSGKSREYAETYYEISDDIWEALNG